MKCKLVILIVFVFAIKVRAQFIGELYYKVDYVVSDSAKFPPKQAEFKKEFINNLNSRIEQESHLGHQTLLVDGADSSNILLIELFDKKIALMLPKDSYTEDQLLKIKKKFQFKKKIVAGYKCKKALIQQKDGSYEVCYYTNKIASELNSKVPGLKGYPLDFTLVYEGYKMHQRVIEIKENPAQEDMIYEIPPGYTKLTMEEFRSMLSQ